MSTKSLILKEDSSPTLSDEEAKKKKQEQLFRIFGENSKDYPHLLNLSEEEMHLIRQRMTALASGATAAIPLLCTPKCPFKEQCIFVEIDRIPLSLPCPIETNLLNEWRRQFIIQYDVDPECPTEIQMCNELAEIELMLWRINNNMAKPENAELVQWDIIAVSQEGTPLEKRVPSTFLEIKDRLSTRKSRLIKLMVGDRQEKYKRDAALKIRDVRDPSESTSNLRKELQTLISQAKEANRKLLNPENPEENLSPEDLFGGEKDE
jgi:hypothetical protein